MKVKNVEGFVVQEGYHLLELLADVEVVGQFVERKHVICDVTDVDFFVQVKVGQGRDDQGCQDDTGGFQCRFFKRPHVEVVCNP